MTDVFGDLAAFTALPRLTGLALSQDGRRLVATVQQPDAEGARYASALWEVPLDGGSPVRLTRSEKGETAPAFRPDGTLLLSSSRPGPDRDEDEPALWALPPSGEAAVLLRRPGGLGGPVVAAGTGAVLMTGSRLARSTEADDEARRQTRKDRGLTAVLHTGMPVRDWDHEVGVESTRLLLLAPGATEPVDLAPDAVGELEGASFSISADGSTVATSWRTRESAGRRPDAVVVLDVASGRRTPVAGRPGWEVAGPVLSPDARLVAAVQERTASYDVPVATVLTLFGAGEPTELDLGDLHPREWVWSADSTTLYVAGDLHGRGGLLAVDAASGEVVRRLARDAVYAGLCPSPDGAALYALRSAMDSAPAPVRLDPAASDQAPHALPTPAPTPPLPGTVEELEVEVGGGIRVHAWLFRPPPSGTPAPVMQWIHGGPFMSYDAWSWRWNPWVAVARGWAVVLPDPALSTGYGQGCIDRAWPYRADVVWREVEAVLDAVLQRPELDGGRLALLGASFGGFMTNWVAGRTDRFGAIVTHAGLWALDQQHATTDAAAYKTGVFGRPRDHPDWYAEFSPHHRVEHISTPVLVSHGSRDFRVPVSEALRLWWDLVSHWDGDPAAMPHRFLQLTGENHWVLSPADAEVWWDALLGFCGQHVLGEPWTPSPLL